MDLADTHRIVERHYMGNKVLVGLSDASSEFLDRTVSLATEKGGQLVLVRATCTNPIWGYLIDIAQSKHYVDCGNFFSGPIVSTWQYH